MTTGDPLYARAAMKPLPTLTKPLRSVDIATKQPAAGAARAHRLLHGAGGRRRRRVDGLLRPGRRLPHEVRRRPHRRRRRARWTPTASASAGPRPASAARLSHGARLRRVHGRGEVLGARRRARHRRARRGPARDADRVVLRGLRRAQVPPARGADRAARAALGRAGDRARRRQRAVGDGARARCSEHTVVWMDISDETAWARAAGDDRPLAGDREAFCALHAERRPLYESIADAFLPEGDRARAPRRARAARARRRAAGHEARVGRGRRRRVPGLRRARADRRPAAARAARVRRHRRARRRAVRRARCATRTTRSRSPRARSTRRWRSRSGCGASWRRAGWGATTIWSRWAAAWSATSRASARRPTSAACPSCRCRRRSSPRSTRPTAARPASTCRRRRTTSAPTTSRRRSSPTSPRWRRCPREEVAAGYAEVVKTALIAGGALWERVAAGAAVDERVVLDCARTKIARRGGGRARRRAAPGAEPRPHGGARDRDRDGVPRATATARRWRWGCWRRCG